MPSGVSEYPERTTDHNRRHDGQAVQAVGQVHRIAGADDDEIGQHNKENTHRYHHRFKEGHDKLVFGRYFG